MAKYLELQTSVQIENYDTLILHKGDILVSETNYFTKEDVIIGAIYNNYEVNDSEYIKCYEYSKFVIEKHKFQNDSTLLYMLINMNMVNDITTRYLRDRLIDDILI